MSLDDIRNRLEDLKKRGACAYLETLLPHEVEGLAVALALHGVNTTREMDIASPPPPVGSGFVEQPHKESTLVLVRPRLEPLGLLEKRAFRDLPIDLNFRERKRFFLRPILSRAGIQRAHDKTVICDGHVEDIFGFPRRDRLVPPTRLKL
jgi:hypothetical protein